jgi:hypothetical protein
MRIFRVVFVMAALVATLLSSPAAFAGKGGDNKPGRVPLLVSSPDKSGEWGIMCGGCGSDVDATCVGSGEECLAACEFICGGPCDYCTKC